MEDNVPLKTLKASEIGNMICDIYACTATNKRLGPGSIDLWLRYCAMPEYANKVYEMRKLPYGSEAQKHFKSNNIPAATLSCTCRGKLRSRSNVEQVNPIIVIDIDYKPEDNENVFLADREKKMKFMNGMIDTGFAYAVGSSCRGTGIWAIIPLASTEIELHFNALIDYFKERGITLDPSCRDVTRLRIASPDDIIRTRYKTLNCYQDKKQKDWGDRKVQPYSNKPDFALKYDKERYSIPEIIDALLSLGFTTNNYDEWLQACFHLLPFGQEGFESFVDISQMSGNFTGVYDCQVKWMLNSKEPPRYTPEQCRAYWKSKLNRFEELLKQNLTS